MKRWKMNYIIFVVTLLIFLGGTGLVYKVHQRYVISIFTQNGLNFERQVEYMLRSAYEDGDSYDYKNLSPEGFALVVGAHSEGYPSMLYILNRKGDIVGASGSYLRVELPDHGMVIIPIHEYITPEAKEALLAWPEEAFLNPFPTVYRLDYRMEGDTLIPVDVWLDGYNNDPAAEHLHLTLAEGEATDSITWDANPNVLNPMAMHFDLQDIIFPDEYYSTEPERIARKLFAKMDEYAENSEQLAQISAETYIYGTYDNIHGASYTDNLYMCWGKINLAGEDYVILRLHTQDLSYRTLHSMQFQTYIGTLLTMCLILLLIALIGANYLYTRSSRLNQARQAFVSGVAHEMKTPLAIIRGQCECVLEGVAPEKNPEYVLTAYREAGRLNDLVMSFLQYSRLQQTRKLVKSQVNLTELLAHEVNRYLPTMEDAGLRVKVQGVPIMNDTPITLMGDPELLKVAIDNFLSNALKYAEPVANSSEPAQVAITLQPGVGAHFQVNVYNDCDSKTLPADDELWTILSRGDASRNRAKNSSGMGLAIAAEILKLHDIQYGVRRLPGGVEFHMKK